MGISKTGCSRSITKEDLDAQYKQGFAEAVLIYRKRLREILERLEEERTLLMGERKEAIEYDDEQIIFATNNQIRAFDYSIRVVKEVGGTND